MKLEGNSNCRIWSAMPSGSGAIVVHRELAQHIPGYCLKSFAPWHEYFPPLLLNKRNAAAEVVHASPDHGLFLAHRHQQLVLTFHNFVLDDAMLDCSSMIQRLHYRTDLLWMTRAALDRAAAVTAVSRFTATLVESFFELKTPVRVIYNGIDVNRFVPRRRREGALVRVLFCGNATRRKGVHLLKEIASRMNPGIQLVCTFSEDDRRKWLGEVANVTAIGKVEASRMPEVYAGCDILLMPTAREGFGLAVAEAMSCGLAIVAADNSTMRELVAEGDGGYRCPLDEPARFAECINRLAATPELRSAMGYFNRRRVEANYRSEDMLGRYRELFDDVQRGTTPFNTFQ